MQIGTGKQGVLIGEYGFSRPQDKKAQHKDGCGLLGWVEPACDNPQWILWFDENGNADIYTSREKGGAVCGNPLRLKARGRDRKIGGAPQASITGNMEIGRIKINGEDHLTIKVDKDGGTLKHVWPDGDVNEIQFGKQDDGRDYEGRDPEKCVNLVGRNNTIILVGSYDPISVQSKVPHEN